MGSVNGSTFFINQGENPDLIFNIKDDSGAAYDLTGGEAVLSYTSPAGVSVEKDCTIATTTATTAFDSATTKLMIGRYTFEFWCRNVAGKIVMTKSGVIEVRKTKSPDAVAV